MEWMRKVCGVMFTFALCVTDASAQQHSESAAANSVSEAPSPYQLTSVKRVSKPSYETVSVEDLPQLMGRTLRIATKNGHFIEGSLEEVRRNQLRLKQEMDGGVAVLPVRFDLIQRMDVLTP